MTTEQTILFIATATSRAIAAIQDQPDGGPPLRVVEALANKLNQLAAVIRDEGRDSFIAAHTVPDGLNRDGRVIRDLPDG